MGLITRTILACLLFTGSAFASTATETFTHADTVGQLFADFSWTRLGGTPGADWGIVTNQAAISGNASSGSDYRMDVQADATGLITIQVTRVSQVGGGDATHFGQFGIYLSDGTTSNNYACYSVRIAGSAPFENYTVGKTVGGVFTSLSVVFQAFAANDVMKFTVNQATGDLNCYVNTILVASANDTSLTGLTYANLNGYTNDAAFSVVADNLSLSSTVDQVGCYLEENNTDFYLLENNSDKYAREGGDGGLCAGGGAPLYKTFLMLGVQ